MGGVFNTQIDLARQSKIISGATAFLEGSISLNENLGVKNYLISSGSTLLTNTFLGSITNSVLALSNTNLVQTIDIDQRINNDINLQKGVANGITPLNSSTKIDQIYLPAIAITDVYVVSGQTAMLALTAHTGDVAIRTDISESFILQYDDPTILSNWVLLAASGVSGGTDTLQVVTSRGNFTNYDLQLQGRRQILNNVNNSSILIGGGSGVNSGSTIEIFGVDDTSFGGSTNLTIGGISVTKTGLTKSFFKIIGQSSGLTETLFKLDINGNLLITNDNTDTIFPQYKLDVQDYNNLISARFNGRVIGNNAVNQNEFITLSGATSLFPQITNVLHLTGFTNQLVSGNTIFVNSQVLTAPSGSTDVVRLQELKNYRKEMYVIGVSEVIFPMLNAGTLSGITGSTSLTNFQYKINSSGTYTTLTIPISYSGNTDMYISYAYIDPLISTGWLRLTGGDN